MIDKQKNQESKGLWNWTRRSFYSELIVLATGYIPSFNAALFTFLMFSTLISTIVLSIIHLVKYKQKAFAVTALVISSILIVIFGLFFVAGLIVGLTGQV